LTSTRYQTRSSSRPAIFDNPIVALNHAVAVAMADGPTSGLQRLETLATDMQLADDHRLYAVRAHLLAMSSETAAACEVYRAAARRATNLPQQRYLIGRAARQLDH
jgi:predicted RNA polymerase sigma factor